MSEQFSPMVERSHDPLLDHLEEARKAVVYARTLEDAWERFAVSAEGAARDAAALDRDLADAERLLRTKALWTPEYRDTLRRRLDAAFDSGDARTRFRNQCGVTMSRLCNGEPFFSYEFVPPRSDMLIEAKGHPFGVVDSDVRDDDLDRIGTMADAGARREAVSVALAIDANATLYRLPSFNLSAAEQRAVYEHAAREASDALAPYLPTVEAEDPAFARTLVQRIISRDLLAGASAIEQLTLDRNERRTFEKRLIAAHPVAIIEKRAEIEPFLRGLTGDEALDFACAQLERALPPSHGARLDAIAHLTVDDVDIADRLAPIVRDVLVAATADARSALKALRTDIARIRGVRAEEISWPDLFNEFEWAVRSQFQRGDLETPRFQEVQREIGVPSRVLPMVLAAAALEEGECSPPTVPEHAFTPTMRRALLAEALAGNRIAPPKYGEEWSGWYTLAFVPRTEEERALMEEYFETVARISPMDYALTFSEVAFDAETIARELPRIRALDDDTLMNVIAIAEDDRGASKVLDQCGAPLAKEILDRLCAREDGAAFLSSTVSHVPARFRGLLVPHVERFRAAGVIPYADAPDAQTAIRAAGAHPLQRALTAMDRDARQRAYLQLQDFYRVHGARGGRAIRSCEVGADFFPDGLASLDVLLTEYPDLSTAHEATRRERDYAETDWSRLKPFITFCSPDRVPELVSDILPALKDVRDGFDASYVLLGFRLREDPRALKQRYGKEQRLVSIHQIANASDPERLFAFLEAYEDDLKERLSDRHSRWTILDHLVAQEDPERAWKDLRRFVEHFATMEPEDARRAAITMNVVLRDRLAQGGMHGFIRNVTSGTHATMAPVRAALLRRLSHPDIREEGITLASLTDDELRLFVQRRLRDVLREAPEHLARADAANRRIAEDIRTGQWALPEGSLVHYSNPEVLPSVLREGNLCGETVGIAGRADSFPLHVDVVRIRGADAPLTVAGLMANEEYHREYSGFEQGVAYCYPRRGATDARFPNEEITTGVRAAAHHLFFVGIPRSELGCIILTEQQSGDAFDATLERVKAAVVQGDCYVPIVNARGDLLFTPVEYDERTAQQKPYASLDALLADDTALDSLDRPQPSAVHEFTLKDHLRAAERNARALATERGVSGRFRDTVVAAARLHDLGKFEAVETGQEIANTLAAERELDRVRHLDPELRRQILVLIRHDELLGDILKGTMLRTDGGIELTEEAQQRIEDFHERFPLPIHRTLMRIVYEADVRAIGNGMYAQWQVAEKLAALDAWVFESEPTVIGRAS